MLIKILKDIFRFFTQPELRYLRLLIRPTLHLSQTTYYSAQAAYFDSENLSPSVRLHQNLTLSHMGTHHFQQCIPSEENHFSESQKNYENQILMDEKSNFESLTMMILQKYD